MVPSPLDQLADAHSFAKFGSRCIACSKHFLDEIADIRADRMGRYEHGDRPAPPREGEPLSLLNSVQ